jgi:nucleoside-diphosphate-sugar epimerase
MVMKRPIIVTGAGGFVGANIVHRLVDDGFTVHALVRGDSNLWRLDNIKNKLIIHSGLLHEPVKLKHAIDKIKPLAIYHLATYGSYPKQTDVNQMVATNVTALINLLDATQDIPYVRFLVSGSSSEYGKKNTPMKESDIPKPNNMYAACKLAATNIILMHARAKAKPITVLRLFNVYGPYEEPGRLVRNVIAWVLSSQPIKLATGREARDFIYVSDVADAFIQATRIDRKLDGEIFNIGTGRQTTIKQLAREVIRLTRLKVPIQTGVYEGRVWDSFRWQADTAKTRKILKWKASVSLESGLQKTITWYKQRMERIENRE